MLIGTGRNCVDVNKRPHDIQRQLLRSVCITKITNWICLVRYSLGSARDGDGGGNVWGRTLNLDRITAGLLRSEIICAEIRIWGG